jgi:hypothetical protein
MDPDATYRLMVDPASDLDEAAVAAVDLLVWFAMGGDVPGGWSRYQTGDNTVSDAKARHRVAVADECKHHIFKALDRLAELEGT